MRNETWALLTATLVLGACDVDPGQPCAGDQDCGDGAFCDQQTRTCVLRERCEPECAGHLQCIQGACEARYSALEIVKPSNGRAGENAVIEVRLVPAPGREVANVPGSLPFEATPMDGGTVETGNLIHAAGGNFKGTWQPTAERRYRLTARYAEAGKEQSVEVEVDLTKPELTVVVPPSGVTGIYADSSAPDAYKRHDRPKLYVTSMDPDIDASSLRFEVRGTNGSNTSDVGMVSGTVTQVDPSTCAGAPVFCAEFSPELWKPEMKAFRADFAVAVTGSDTAGNEAPIASSTVKVTRQRWAYATGESIKGTPAIGSSGRVYVGVVSSPNTGSLRALSQTGVELWSVNEGAISGSPAVATVGGEERVFFASFAEKPVVETPPEHTRLISVRGADGLGMTVCAQSLDAEGPGPVVIGRTTRNNVEATSATVVVNEGIGRILTFRPEAGSGNRCVLSDSNAKIAEDATVATDGTRLFIGDDVGGVRAFTFNGSWGPTPVWGPIQVGDAGSTIRGLAVQSGTLAVATNKGLFQMDVSTGVVGQKAPADASPGTFAPAIVTGSRTVFGASPTALFEATGAQSRSVTLQGETRSVPLAGADGTIYVVTSNGWLQAWDQALQTELWSAALAGSVDPGASPTIDCGRDASGYDNGVLYFGGNTGRVYAVDVDSRGIDVNAPWPKFQHDPRNTGNATTNMAEFACP